MADFTKIQSSSYLSYVLSLVQLEPKLHAVPTTPYSFGIAPIYKEKSLNVCRRIRFMTFIWIWFFTLHYVDAVEIKLLLKN